MIPNFDPSYKGNEFKIDPDRPDRKNGWKWYRMRRAYLKQHPWCERCGLLGEEVHHILARHTHPDQIYNWNNLLTLCSYCHAKEHGFGGENNETQKIQSSQSTNRH